MGEKALKSRVADIIGNGGAVSRCLDKYESRPQQISMADAVCEAIEGGTHLMVEAGTGVGKSLAYLTPLVIHAVENKKKVIVSTNTKTLQQQLCEKDLPLLKRCLGIDFNYALCVGSENYVCLRRLGSDYTYSLFASDQQFSESKKIIDWAAVTGTGLASDLGFKPSAEVWNKVCRDSDLCLADLCAHKTGCFYRKAKRLERSADILVANHALFFVNIASGGRVLPVFHAAVIDESHMLEEVASSYLGVTVNSSKVKYLLDSICHEKTGKGILTKFLRYKDKVGDVKANLKATRAACDVFFEEMAKKLDLKTGTRRLRQKNIINNSIEGPFRRLIDSLDSLIMIAKTEEDEKMVKSCKKKCAELTDGVSSALAMQDPDYVYWFAMSPRKGGVVYSICSAPIEIAEELKKQLFDMIRPIILTSATLSIRGSFKFIGKRLGVEDCAALLLDSPFDYEKNALLYMPEDIPDPTDDAQSFNDSVIAHTKEILDILGGRTFVLFTNYRMLNAVYEVLRKERKGLNLLKQGDKPRYELLNDFKINSNSVLLGTDTFWQGIDVPGSALECVIITKLPFSVPNDPITEARMELIKSRGKNAFAGYLVPQAVMMLRQGFGRLIRSNSDRGVVVILDPRIRTKAYGKEFIDALPKCRHTSKLEDVKTFFEKQISSIVNHEV